MSSREIEESIKRIEDDLYFSSDSVLVRLGRIEDKLEHAVPRRYLGGWEYDIGGLISDLKAHLNKLFRWTIVVLVLAGRIMLAVLKLT